jgi:hypothetical protein
MDAELCQLGRHEVAELCAGGVAVLEHDRQRRADEWHFVKRVLVEELAVIQVPQPLVERRGRRSGREQRADDRAGGGAGDPLELRAVLLEDRRRADVLDAENPTPGEDEVDRSRQREGQPPALR